jgi:phosphoenolpyruvate phosphomutase
MMKKATLLRALFASRPIVRIVGAHNALGAKLIEKNGFDGIWASGLEVSAAHAVPDANILTMTDNLHAASVINDAGALPVICDCDTGYGGAANVWHMIRKYDAAGLAAAVIEDKTFPKINSFVGAPQELLSIEDFAGKLAAAVDARRNPDFMIFARVEALIAGHGMEEALKRAHAYVDAGADGVVIHSKAKTPSEIYEFAAKWKNRAPLVAIPTTYSSVTATELAEKGFKMAIYANQGLRASIRAMDRAFKSIADNDSTAGIENEIASLDEVFELQGMPDLKTQEEKFSRKEPIQAVIAAAWDHAGQKGFGEILRDKPLCAVDIGGKALLERQTLALRSSGINEIFVVGGRLSGKIKVDGFKLLVNPRPDETGSAFSFMQAAPHFKKRCVLAYSDILYDRRIVERLLDSPYAVTVVIDRAYTSLPPRQKKLDLVSAEDVVKPGGSRSLSSNEFRTISAIGGAVDAGKANAEFIGLAYFQDKGLEWLKTAWTGTEGSLDKADLVDVLQHLIVSGKPVHAVTIEHGWSEIHSADDLRRVRDHYESGATALNSTP